MTTDLTYQHLKISVITKNRRKSARKRQKGHETRPLDRRLDLTLTTGTIAAALTRKNLAAISQKLLQSLNVLVVNVLRTLPAKTTLRLLTSA
jgi:hypothetical protein